MTETAKLMLAAATFATALGIGTHVALANVPDTHAAVELKNLEGNVVGNGTLTQTPHGVLVHVKVSDMPPGAKGIHFHSKADCAADTGFKSSLGHHGEGKGEHGLLNAQGPGMGDLGNIFVGENGVGEMQFFKDGVYLDKGDLPLLDTDGTAIVIHANMDDQVTQPIGGAGARLVCGMLKAG